MKTINDYDNSDKTKGKEAGSSPYTCYNLTPRIHYNDINNSSSVNTIKKPNLFYHPYPFTPIFVNKNYSQNKKYKEFLPKNSYKDISIKEEIIKNLDIHSRIMKMSSLKGDKSRYHLNKLNSIEYGNKNVDDTIIKNNSNCVNKYKIIVHENNKSNNNLTCMKSYSFLNNTKGSFIVSDEDNRNINSKSNNNQSQLFFTTNNKKLRAYNMSPNKYSVINRSIIEKNNSRIANCIQLRHQPTISKDKILITSLSKSVFSLKNDRLYKRMKFLDKNLRKIMERKQPFS